MKIDLNCDLGEGIGNDQAIMPYITSANIACGFHAGDEQTMRETLRLTKRFGVNAGAHPGWKDRENFGRKEMDISPAETERLVFEQIQTLAAIAKEEGVMLTHVKPHGALYNQSAKDFQLASAIARAVKTSSVDLILVGLAGSRLIEAGRAVGLRAAAEGFPDRGYNADGSLMSRLLPGAIIESPEEVARHAVELIRKGGMDTLCLHGDHPNAAANAKVLRDVLEKNGVAIAAIT
ncbi:MAG: LamB/YcsF family protein [Chloroflexi bacterium]|nr:MAG: LamB/YcsF family protein [Chloroflexota bacterium]MCQ3936924.1 LamB/YcsF family protein [Chloroflexota bacterium]MDL1942760.1 LamB/YcsF family protein [Chloroflexi bacterium CFX2]